MERENPLYGAYVKILQEELIPATGCTEPIAIAYAAAKAREVLCAKPEKMTLAVSGSILKNAKSASVPGTGGRKGVKVALAAGVLVGDAAKKLEVIAHIPPSAIPEIAAYAESCPMEVGLTDDSHLFEIVLLAFAGGSRAKIHIIDAHTNLVLVEKDGLALFKASTGGEEQAAALPYHLLTVADIVDFAESADIADIAPILEPQRRCNWQIAQEGMAKPYGANLGKTLLSCAGGDCVQNRAKAYAAAASDARMGGCDKPVVITAGSGNQGITASVPVLVYAEELGSSEEELYRAMALSALLTIHQKNSIGKLSAFCGAVCAGAGAGAGITYLKGGRYEEICHSLVNALAILSGMVCDGAKPSCAAKIAMAVEAGILGYEMYARGEQFYRGDGLVAAGVEKTIANIGRLGKDGMHSTNREILDMMTCSCDS